MSAGIIPCTNYGYTVSIHAKPCQKSGKSDNPLSSKPTQNIILFFNPKILSAVAADAYSKGLPITDFLFGRVLVT